MELGKRFVFINVDNVISISQKLPWKRKIIKYTESLTFKTFHPINKTRFDNRE